MSRPTATVEPYRSLAGLFAFLVFVQAFLAGQFLNGRGSLTSIHRVLGAQVVPLMAILMFAAAFWLSRKDRLNRSTVIVGGAILIVTMVQTGLGFAGRQSSQMAALHIPVGVALFGLAILNYVYSFPVTARNRRGSLEA